MTFGKVTYGKIPQLLEKFLVIPSHSTQLETSLWLLMGIDPFSKCTHTSSAATALARLITMVVDCQGCPDRPPGVSESYWSVLEGCWTYNPAGRPTAVALWQSLESWEIWELEGRHGTISLLLRLIEPIAHVTYHERADTCSASFGVAEVSLDVYGRPVAVIEPFQLEATKHSSAIAVLTGRQSACYHCHAYQGGVSSSPPEAIVASECKFEGQKWMAVKRSEFPVSSPASVVWLPQLFVLVIGASRKLRDGR
ncbi:hypothetical protein FA13DRAFT_1713931 [Coprinellus micaceus]|uniref:Serine-threonine/tyrosine-protein kinase catalytic domain-containing protein n=1 Tax=Coprinellus micaceus TaxID=71717 RepID=A0A4Y7SW89_COPMI|nr:hypothetical protein FA13DRAFT_1713931 [Coprinellus micaceus]